MTEKPEPKKQTRRKRADGEGTIYRIKTGPRKGTWVGQLTTKTINPKTGRPKRKSFYGTTQTDVRAQMEEYKDQMNQGLDLETAKRLSFGEWVVHWLDLYKKPKIRLATYERYTGYITRDIIPAFGHVALADLTTHDIQALYTKLHNEGKSPSTIQNVHQIVLPCLQKAVDTRLLPHNPAISTERPAQRRPSGKAMPEEDMAKFLATLDEQDDKWKAAFLTLLGTGLRIGELLALEWDDIDLEEGIISISKNLSRTKDKGLIIERPKTETSAAQVPVPDFVLQAIKRHRTTQAAWALKQGEKYRNRKLVFSSNKGTYMSPRNFQRKHYALLEAAKVEHINLHGLRHTFATRLLEQGENLKVVQELLRHADVSTTGNIYSHVTAKVKKQAAQKMDNLLQKRLS